MLSASTLSTSGLRARRRVSVLACMAVAAILAMIVGAGPARADDVRDAQMWVLNAIRARAAWRTTQGQGVTVAVIDSGVKPDVSDLTGSVITGPDYTGVGTRESNPNWGIHGTWMASLIAGHGHDGGGSGILGVAPRSHVLSIRVITDSTDPGYSRYAREPQSRVQGELADAINYAVSHGAGVISMSLGYGAPSLQVRSALQNAFNHGVVIVASSGNSGDNNGARQGNAPYSFPADYPGVIGVAALNSRGEPAGFSSDNISVQVAAPGVDVPAQGRDGQYWLVSGTSPACALTAGVAALIKAADPSLPPDLISEAITSTTTNRPPGGYDEEVGFGTVNAAAALTAAAQLSAGGLAGPGAPDSRSSATGSRSSGRASATPGGRASGPGSDSTASRDSGGLRPASNTSPLTAGISAATHFGGGPAAVPSAPVGPRGTRQLLVLCVLALACTAVIVVTMGSLGRSRRSPALAADQPVRPPPSGSGTQRIVATAVPPGPSAGDGVAGGGVAEANVPPTSQRLPWSRPPGRHALPKDTGRTAGPPG
jgi:subtilisin family serine protease